MAEPTTAVLKNESFLIDEQTQSIILNNLKIQHFNFM